LSRLKFDQCYDAHCSQILGYALRRVDGRHAAEEVLAETYAVAWRRRDSIPNEPLPWLYAIAARVISNQRRSTRRRLRLVDRTAAEPEVFARDPADLVAERDLTRKAFAKLSAPQREVLRLAAWEGLDATDAAVVLGCSAGAFRVRLHRARRDLEKHLALDGHVPTGRPVSPRPRPATQESK
jgi:RNA polymerase sigma-70 factor (ECF subfamily)